MNDMESTRELSFKEKTKLAMKAKSHTVFIGKWAELISIDKYEAIRLIIQYPNCATILQKNQGRLIIAP